jgi:hypothetical protein
MKNIYLIIVFVVLTSCQQNEIQLDQLQGYWEISKAESSEGKSKSFTVNSNIDYIVLEDSTGFRKKVKPLYSGKFQGSKDIEKFKLKETKDKVSLIYTTLYDTWEEEIMELTAEKFVVKNSNGVTYTYNRYKALNEFDEEK